MKPEFGKSRADNKMKVHREAFSAGLLMKMSGYSGSYREELGLYQFYGNLHDFDRNENLLFSTDDLVAAWWMIQGYRIGRGRLNF